ncbi:RHS repeat protein [Solimonas sp. K1W22B-7]|uniref:RHS repeat-associated core domain-containing protein n=1 Tax=Solimonas sp. K1W22B-7 TaxID=2303331 RepID=UPI000E335003|nr:RHS repeat-associated core domain-containing protein [Solimonas sp. K1W22B-7]AXQ29557.1 RHS repeat protein [Solimonas sp. K1W22B-7]
MGIGAKKRGLLLPALFAACMPAYAYHYPWDQGHDTTGWEDVTHEPGEPKSDCPLPGNECGSPLYLRTGHLVWNDTDIQLAGTVPLGLSRTFNSNDPKDGPFGVGWSFNYESSMYRTAQLAETESGAVASTQYTLRVANGRRLQFTKGGDGSITAPSRFHGTLSDAGDNVQMRHLGGAIETFDRFGALVGSVDQNGNTLTYNYDGSQRITKVANAFGQSLTFAYGANGRVSRVTDHTGRAWTYVYDAEGRLATVTDPLGGKRRYSYQSWQPQADAQIYAQLTAVADEAGKSLLAATYDDDRVSAFTEGERKTTVSYTESESGDIVAVTENDSGNSTWSFVVNPGDGQYTQVTNGLGHVYAYEYDSRGYVTKTIDPTGHAETTVTDELGRATAMNDGRKDIVLSYEGKSPRPRKIRSGTRTTTLGYDAKDNLIAVTDAAGNSTSFTRDGNGRVTAVTDPLNQRSALEYDSRGFAIKQTDPLGRSISFVRDDLGRATSITNADRETTSFVYDALDRVIESTDPLGRKTKFEYDAAGRLAKLTVPNGAAEAYEYDAYGRLITTTHYNGRKTRATYRSDNLIETQTNPQGTLSTFRYDSSKRLTEVAAGALFATYAYDERDLLTRATNETATVERTYDQFGRLLSEETNGRKVGYSYNVHDELASLSSNGKTDSYGYDARGLLTSLKSRHGDYSLSWDALGRMSGMQYPNGLMLANTYDTASQLATRQYGSVRRWSYGYDAAGRITGISEDSTAQTYGYDDLGRLTAANTLAGKYSYAYDAMGNRTEAGQTYNSANEILSGLGETFEHDANGNMVKRTAADGSYIRYGYDDRERLVQTDKFASAEATVEDWRVTYAYDPFGRRIMIDEDGTKKEFLWSGSTMVAEYDGAGNVLKDYAYGPGYAPLSVNGAAGTSFLLSDHLSTPQAAVNGSLSLTWSQKRSPYGEVVATTGTAATAIGFPGQYADGLSRAAYNYFRDSDPALGRYLQNDPIGVLGDINTYAYVGGNPISNIDPTGEFLVVPIVVGAVVGAGVDLAAQLLRNGGDLNCVDLGELGVSALAGAAFSGFGPTGFLLGRGGARAVGYGYSESAGLLNTGATRFGWGYRASTNSDVLRAVVNGAKTDIPGTAIPAGANAARDGAIAGAIGGGSTAAANSSCGCK